MIFLHYLLWSFFQRGASVVISSFSCPSCPRPSQHGLLFRSTKAGGSGKPMDASASSQQTMLRSATVPATILIYSPQRNITHIKFFPQKIFEVGQNLTPTFTSINLTKFAEKQIKYIILNIHHDHPTSRWKFKEDRCPQSSYKGAGMTSAKATSKPKSRKREGAKQNPQTLRHLVPPISCLVFCFSSNVSGGAERQSREETYCPFLALYFASLQTFISATHFYSCPLGHGT